MTGPEQQNAQQCEASCDQYVAPKTNGLPDDPNAPGLWKTRCRESCQYMDQLTDSNPGNTFFFDKTTSISY